MVVVAAAATPPPTPLSGFMVSYHVCIYDTSGRKITVLRTVKEVDLVSLQGPGFLNSVSTPIPCAIHIRRVSRVNQQCNQCFPSSPTPSEVEPSTQRPVADYIDIGKVFDETRYTHTTCWRSNSRSETETTDYAPRFLLMFFSSTVTVSYQS